MGNLIPVTERTKDERRAICVAGGKANGEQRRRRKAMRECLQELLALPSKMRDMSLLESICVSMAEKAEQGDTRAAEFVRDLIGEKPSTHLDHSSTDGTMSPQGGADLGDKTLTELMALTRAAWGAEHGKQ